MCKICACFLRDGTDEIECYRVPDDLLPIRPFETTTFGTILDPEKTTFSQPPSASPVDIPSQTTSPGITTTLDPACTTESSNNNTDGESATTVSATTEAVATATFITDPDSTETFTTEEGSTEPVSVTGKQKKGRSRACLEMLYKKVCLSLQRMVVKACFYFLTLKCSRRKRMGSPIPKTIEKA